MATLVFLAGCAHGPAANGGKDAAECRGSAIAPCTRQPARYPDWLVGLADPVAPLVGRTIALVKFREGHLADKPDALALLERTLQPLDILLVSSKGRLTSSAIPGLFTHTVVYLGTQPQLERLGLWDDPALEPFRDRLHGGKIFVESDKRGVHLSALDQISDADRVLVLRPRLREPSWVRRTMLAFFGHVGSRFDFRFNAGDDRRLYCSELAFHVMPELKLPVRHFYNRDVVLPDDIAAAGLEPGTRLSFVLYLQGTRTEWSRGTRREAIADLAAYWRK